MLVYLDINTVVYIWSRCSFHTSDYHTKQTACTIRYMDAHHGSLACVQATSLQERHTMARSHI